MWPPEALSLHPDKSCIISVLPTGDEHTTWWSSHAALVPTGNNIATGIPGSYFTLNSKATFQRTPFVARFEATNDEVILAYKISGKLVSAVGITVDKLIAFKPPKGRSDEVDEASLLSSRKLPFEGIQEVTKLQNTATHKLADLTDVLIGNLPLQERWHQEPQGPCGD